VPSDPPDAALLPRLVEAIGLHVFIGEVAVDGYREIFTGPGLEALMGGAPPPGADADAEWAERVHPEDRPAYRTAMDRIHGGQPDDVEYRMVGYDGVTRWVWERGRPRRDGARLLVDGFALDITDRREVESELRAALARLEDAHAEADRRSRIDDLTGAYNRSHLHEALQAELARAAREGNTPALLMVDIDHFKHVNDSLGHLAGDAVLVQAAGRLREAVRPYDVVARWGGEEFAILVPAVPDDHALRSIGESLRSAIGATPYSAGGTRLALTASVGGARVGPGRDTTRSLVDAADRGLYLAKRQGRDRVQLTDDPVALRAGPSPTAASIVAELRESLGLEELSDSAAALLDAAARLALRAAAA
jgi:diguanylate cyclase (GGDEF)-like protein